MARRTKKRGASTVNVDLSGVETTKLPTAGVYNVEVESVEEKTSQSGNPTLKWVFAITDGKFEGSKLFENTSLQPQALFKLKALLEGIGVEIPNKAFDLNLPDLIGLEATVEVVTETYEGKKRPVITEYITDDEDEDDDEESDDELLEALEELDEDELKDIAKELGVKKSKLKKLDEEEIIDEILDNYDEDEIWELLDEDEDDEDDEDDDEEEDYEEMTLKELKAEAKDRGLKVKKGMDKDDIIEMLEEDDE